MTRDGSSWGIRHLRTVAGTEQSFVTVNGKEYPGTGFAYVGTGVDDYFSWVSGGVDVDAVYHRFTKELSTKTLYTVTKSGDGVTVSAGEKPGDRTARSRAVPGRARMAPTGGLLARVDENRFVALVDGVESPAVGPYARVYDFTIGDGGAGWGFTAVPDAKAPASVRTVINGREYGPYSWTDRPRFGMDGTGFYFWAAMEGKSPRGALVFNGTAWGPFASDFAWRLFDLEAGIFALESRSNAGSTLQVNGESFGPYREVEILRTGTPSRDETGRYFGFVAVMQDGSRELHVHGDKVYGPYRDLGTARAWISDDGKDWMFSASKPGSDAQVLLRNGVEQETKGIDLRPWGDGFLLFVRQVGAERFHLEGWAGGPLRGGAALVDQPGRAHLGRRGDEGRRPRRDDRGHRERAGIPGAGPAIRERRDGRIFHVVFRRRAGRRVRQHAEGPVTRPRSAQRDLPIRPRAKPSKTRVTCQACSSVPLPERAVLEDGPGELVHLVVVAEQEQALVVELAEARTPAPTTAVASPGAPVK